MKLIINKKDLANNPKRHPGLQDLDLWTRDQLVDFIAKKHLTPRILDVKQQMIVSIAEE